MNRSRVTGDLASHGNIFVDIANDRVGIGSTIPGQKLSLPDNAKIALGNSADLQISHDGSHSFIQNTTGLLVLQDTSGIYLRSDDIRFQSDGGSETYATLTKNGAVALNFDNNNRFQTKDYGVEVIGTTDTDGLIVSGVSTFSNRATITHDLTISGTAPRVIFADTDNNPDYRIDVDGGSFSIQDTTNGNANRFVINNAGNVTIPGNFDVVGNIAGFGDLTLTDTTADSAAGPEFKLFRNSASPADADYLGQIKFAGESDTGVERNYAKITGKILDASNGTEDGIIEFAHIKAGSQVITGRWRSDSLQLLNGTALTVAGSTTVTGNIIPSSDSATDIGTNSVRFANIYGDTIYGDGSNLTGITQTTLNNNADNRVITGSGTANTLNAESTLTYNGSGTLEINDSGSSYTLRGAGVVKHGMDASSSDNDLVFQNNRTAQNVTSNVIFKGSGASGATVSEKLRIDSAGNMSLGKGAAATTNYGRQLQIHSTVTSGAALHLTNITSGSGNSDGFHLVLQGHIYHWLREDAHQIFATQGLERMRLTSGGQLLLGTTSGGLATGDEFVISTSGHTGMTIRSGTSGEGNIFFGDSDYGASGIIRYDHSNDSMQFKTNSTGQERLNIASNGDVKVVARGSSDSGAPFYVAVTGKSSITYGGGNDDTACLRIKDVGSTNSYYHGLELRSRQGADVRLYCQDKGNDVSDFVIATDNGGITEKMRVTATGMVGIGNRTTSPNSLLHVHTSSGDANARIEGGSHARLRLTAHSGSSIIEFGDSGSDSVGKISYTHSSNDLSFRTSGTDRLTLTSDGRLELTSNEGIFVKSSGDNAGAQIRFSTATQSSYSQIGHIKYFHGDNSITTNYGEGMVMGGTESNGFVLRLDGALNIKDSDSAGGDGAKILLGTDRDMRIYHSGGDGFYDLTGSGGMRFRVNDLIFQNYNNSGGATRRVRFYGDEGIEIFTVTNSAGGSSGGAIIAMSDASDFSQIGKIRYVHSDNSVVDDGTSECFVMEGSEAQTAFKLDGRMYISDSKFVLKPTFSSFDNIPNGNSNTHVGCMMKYHSEINGNCGVMSNADKEPFIANRSGSDGIIMRIRHQGNTEGQITVSGGQVSYQNFMGAHKAQFVDHSKPDILIGTVLEAVDQLATWKYASFSVGVGTDATTKYIPYYGSKNDGETDTIIYDSNTYSATIKDHRDPMPEMTKHVCVKVSDTVGSKAVFGVFYRWEEEDVIERESGNAEYSWNDLDVAAIGNFYIRMQSGQTPAIGDYVESAGDGTAKVQSDDILRSKTIAKITSTTKQKTYDDGSFIVTCTLHCG